MLRSALGRHLPKPSFLCFQSLRHETPISIQRSSIKTIVYQQYCLFNNSAIQLYERSKNRDMNNDDRPSEKKKTYGNRRFVNLKDAERRANRHLYTLPRDVYGTSDRVAQLLKLTGIDEAIEFVQHLPLDLQSTVVWNQLLGYCAEHGRANLAEKLFTQMRKRGMYPSDWTFGHLLTAFANSTSRASVERAEGWIQRMEQYQVTPTTLHYNMLLKVYENAQQYNHVVAKVRQMMRDDGLLPFPDKVTLSIALKTCPVLVNNPNKEIKRIWQYILDRLTEQQQQQPSSSSLLLSNKDHRSPYVSSLQAKVDKLLSTDTTFRQDQDALQEQSLSNRTQREPLDVDDALVVALLRALGRTSIRQKKNHDGEDHLALVMDIMEQLYGLRPFNTSNKKLECFNLKPGVKVLDGIVRYCGAIREFELGEAYFDLALQQFPSLEPDQQAYDAYAWMQSNTRRKNRRKGDH
ncbi:uncharacterized protein BX664DRAFT_339938 [Halteromyces radiatus]|uniref:uncharacterized protein n=1 Tax=Halteromyces radiatus TaxID=101107 RepID=UPI00221F3B55|nr:uncharacterized protein BX664DRAFT_339938 [Halteromyces radiatus]KAI8083158.1 hypothetical protein BX664DRAFT_339938 [Halteromyces radiatus]